MPLVATTFKDQPVTFLAPRFCHSPGISRMRKRSYAWAMCTKRTKDAAYGPFLAAQATFGGEQFKVGQPTVTCAVAPSRQRRSLGPAGRNIVGRVRRRSRWASLPACEADELSPAQRSGT